MIQIETCPPLSAWNIPCLLAMLAIKLTLFFSIMSVDSEDSDKEENHPIRKQGKRTPGIERSMFFLYKYLTYDQSSN